MKILLVLLVLLCLTGCAGIGQLQDKGASISDELLVTAEWSMCKAVSVGAWVRAYGADQAKAEAWRVLCSVKVEQTPVAPQALRFQR